MAISNRTRPEVVIDKNGKVTTVHKLAEQKGGKERIRKLGRVESYTTNDGTEKATLRFTVTETASLIRETLKEQFKADYPDVKFSVRSDRYSMGASINVSYTDGPPSGEVEKFLKEYEAATYNGHFDMKEYKSHKTQDGMDVAYGADYVFVRRDLSAQAEDDAKKVAQQVIGSNFRSSDWYSTPEYVRNIMIENPGYSRSGPKADLPGDMILDMIATYQADKNRVEVPFKTQAYSYT